jgi:hypothetical protein
MYQYYTDHLWSNQRLNPRSTALNVTKLTITPPRGPNSLYVRTTTSRHLVWNIPINFPAMHNNLFFRLKKISLLWLKHNKYCLFATIVTRPSISSQTLIKQTGMVSLLVLYIRLIMLPSIAHSPVNGNIEETKISIDNKLHLDLQSSRTVCTCGLHVLGLVTIVANKQYSYQSV